MAPIRPRTAWIPNAVDLQGGREGGREEREGGREGELIFKEEMGEMNKKSREGAEEERKERGKTMEGERKRKVWEGREKERGGKDGRQWRERRRKRSGKGGKEREEGKKTEEGERKEEVWEGREGEVVESWRRVLKNLAHCEAASKRPGSSGSQRHSQLPGLSKPQSHRRRIMNQSRIPASDYPFVVCEK